jgi:ribonuclease P protein component, eubacterial
LNSPHTFRKEERISSKREIGFLFENGTSFVSYPLRILFCKREIQGDARFSVLISVSKRKFKRAVDRNRIKRLIREAYRLNKSILWNTPPPNDCHRRPDSQPHDNHCELPHEIVDQACNDEVLLNIGFIFIGKERPDFKQIESAIIKALSVIVRKNDEA